MNESRRAVKIVDTGVANIASLVAALKRLNYDPQLTRNVDHVQHAERLVLPGVGSFGAAMKVLDELDLIQPLRDRFQQNKSTLAICLGMQLLCQASEESPGVEGLGVIPVTVKRFGHRVQVPQLGWNEVEFQDKSIFPPGHAYFANSFRLLDQPPDWEVACSDYDGPFFSAITRGKILVTQFHPELSGAWGQSLLQTWLNGMADNNMADNNLADSRAEEGGC